MAGDRKKILDIINKIGFDFDWDEKKVWKLKVLVKEINISELKWHFNIPFWSPNKKEGYGLKPKDVINNPDKYSYQYKRTMRSDLSHPIDIMKNKGRWLILDGLHRLVKMQILGYTKVKVRKIPRSQISKIKK